MPNTIIGTATDNLDEIFEDVDAKGEKLNGRRFENCSFKNCSFSDASFRDVTLIECKFDGCDLSNTQFTGARMRDSTFQDSKLIGINWASASALSGVSFQKCILNLSVFQSLDLRKCAIVDCAAREADFSETNLSEANLRGTDFSGARFSNTKLEKADLRNAVNYAIDPNENRIKKAKFSLPEAMSLLQGLGIEVEE